MKENNDISPDRLRYEAARRTQIIAGAFADNIGEHREYIWDALNEILIHHHDRDYPFRDVRPLSAVLIRIVVCSDLTEIPPRWLAQKVYDYYEKFQTTVDELEENPDGQSHFLSTVVVGFIEDVLGQDANPIMTEEEEGTKDGKIHYLW